MERKLKKIKVPVTVVTQWLRYIENAGLLTKGSRVSTALNWNADACGLYLKLIVINKQNNSSAWIFWAILVLADNRQKQTYRCPPTSKDYTRYHWLIWWCNIHVSESWWFHVQKVVWSISWSHLCSSTCAMNVENCLQFAFLRCRATLASALASLSRQILVIIDIGPRIFIPCMMDKRCN